MSVNVVAELLGANYDGDTNNGRMEGYGEYTFPDGVTYAGEFHHGTFHGKGELRYPNGGRYVSEWYYGRERTGYYVYGDQLQYEKEGWDYLSSGDRRFHFEKEYAKQLHKDGSDNLDTLPHQEVGCDRGTTTGSVTLQSKNGILPAGNTQLSNRPVTEGTNHSGTESTLPGVPEGCYDCGNGCYYNPSTKRVYGIESGELQRKVGQSEQHWIEDNCAMASKSAVQRADTMELMKKSKLHQSH
eukprot:gb/GECG01001413.1/.p1 GENE.gb/GECG01001413.1/~~gb/GECG01001413.1/.p1  ORF type:complete len:242 (+),score=30.38 gb/GECG01001413.1/:1-726(+)